MQKEPSYFDKNGVEIKEFSLVKMYHYTGRKRGRGREKHYMYKWIRLCAYNDGVYYYMGCHLDGNDFFEKNSKKILGEFSLRALADENRKIDCLEVLQ
jgi:hypothetical protein